jgi:hypothetical protein
MELRRQMGDVAGRRTADEEFHRKIKDALGIFYASKRADGTRFGERFTHYFPSGFP